MVSMVIQMVMVMITVLNVSVGAMISVMLSVFMTIDIKMISLFIFDERLRFLYDSFLAYFQQIQKAIFS